MVPRRTWITIIDLLKVVAEDGMPDRGIVWRGGGLLINTLPAGADGSWSSESEFKIQFRLWVDKVRSKPRVFPGYCGKAKSTADALTLDLEHTLGVSVRNYALDFIAGGTILDEIEKSAREVIRAQSAKRLIYDEKLIRLLTR